MAVNARIKIVAHHKDGTPFEVVAYDDAFDLIAVGASLATKRIKDALEHSTTQIFGDIKTDEEAYNTED